MNFFLISNMYPTLEYPGYGSFVKNIAELLSRSGIKEKCQAVIKGRSKTKLKKIFNYFCFYLKILTNYWKKYDFIYIHFPNHAAPILLPLLAIRRKSLIVNFHGEDLLYNSKGYGKILGEMMERMCKLYATSVIVPSEYFKSIVIERNIIESKKIIVSPSGGIDKEIFYPKPYVDSKPNFIHLGYVGRMEKDKGIIEFLEVCKRLKDSGEEFLATAIGYGGYFEQAQKFIIDNHLKTVELIKGLPQKNLGKYYRSFDLLIFSSSRDSESLGLTGIEAMACGTPVIGSNVGGIASYVISGYNGWLTEVHDVKSIEKLIYRYKRLNFSEKIKMLEGAANTGKKYYSDLVGRNLSKEIFLLFSS